GEYHNNPICHWLQLKLTKDLFKQKGENLVLAAEMFETDNQLVLNEYLSGFIKETNFEKEAKLWSNFSMYARLPCVVRNSPVDTSKNAIPNWSSVAFFAK
ncbi:MAG: hypothetical protein EAZ80_03290, partial [Runella slithyformis]